MIALIVRRLAWAVVVAGFVVTATFAMLTAIPADPARAIVGPHATAATLARVRAHYCLDRSLLARYGCFVGRIAAGDLGESFRTERPVADLLGERAWPSLQLVLAAALLQLAVGVPLGVLAARRRGVRARLADGVAVLAQSVPAFVVGTLAIYLVAYRLGWLPTSGYGAPGWDRLRHLVLPAATLATGGVAYYARLVRAGVGDALAADFVRTARAKGLPERTVVWRHALRVALGPVLALVGVDLGALLGGAVVVEAVFAWPGLGREVVIAILDVDLPVILGVVVVGAFAVVIGNLVADLAHLALDPRLRDG